MVESEGEQGPIDQESKENLPPFETIRRIAVAELGPVNTLSFQEAMTKIQEIAGQEGVSNPLLVVVVQDVLLKREFVLNQDEAEAQWSELIDVYEDDELLAMPVAFVVDGSKYYF